MSETASSTGNLNIIAFVESRLGPENLPFEMEVFTLRLCSSIIFNADRPILDSIIRDSGRSI